MKKIRLSHRTKKAWKMAKKLRKNHRLPKKKRLTKMRKEMVRQYNSLPSNYKLNVVEKNNYSFS